MNWKTRSLSDRVADRIRDRRGELAMSREDLAAACGALGAPELTYATITNIETGRRNKDRERRRDVTVDELVVIAKALDISPLGILFDVGRQDLSEAIPQVDVMTWASAQWFSGRRPLPFRTAQIPESELELRDGRYGPSDPRPGAYGEDDPGGGDYNPATELRDWYNDADIGWKAGGAAVTLYYDHDDHKRQWEGSGVFGYELAAGEDALAREISERIRAIAERELVRIRADLTRHKLALPWLPDHIEERVSKMEQGQGQRR